MWAAGCVGPTEEESAAQAQAPGTPQLSTVPRSRALSSSRLLLGPAGAAGCGAAGGGRGAAAGRSARGGATSRAQAAGGRLASFPPPPLSLLPVSLVFCPEGRQYAGGWGSTRAVLRGLQRPAPSSRADRAPRGCRQAEGSERKHRAPAFLQGVKAEGELRALKDRLEAALSQQSAAAAQQAQQAAEREAARREAKAAAAEARRLQEEVRRWGRFFCRRLLARSGERGRHRPGPGQERARKGASTSGAGLSVYRATGHFALRIAVD